MTSESISSSDSSGLTVAVARLDWDDPYGPPILHLRLAANITTSQLVDWVASQDELRREQETHGPLEVRVEGGTLSSRKVRRALRPYLGKVSVRMIRPPHKF
jgi:hypothetical protein